MYRCDRSMHHALHRPIIYTHTMRILSHGYITVHVCLKLTWRRSGTLGVGSGLVRAVVLREGSSSVLVPVSVFVDKPDRREPHETQQPAKYLGGRGEGGEGGREERGRERKEQGERERREGGREGGRERSRERA